jgi:hypothetical protein
MGGGLKRGGRSWASVERHSGGDVGGVLAATGGDHVAVTGCGVLGEGPLAIGGCATGCAVHAPLNSPTHIPPWP